MKAELFFTALIWFFTLLFFVLVSVKQKRIRFFSSLMILLSVTFFSLLSPSGEILLTIGRLQITLDSLLLGLRKSGILIGMVFLSRLLTSFSPKTALVRRFGKVGNKLTEVFYWLNLLTEKKIPLNHGHIIEAIDERLCEIWKSV